MEQKRPIHSLEGEIVGEIALPEIFEAEVRSDLIKRVYLSQLTSRIQPQGRDPRSGLKTSAESWGVGRAVARVPRVKGRHHRAAGTAARAPFVRGGRPAHPPRSEKVVKERVNKRERRLAIGSAIGASASAGLVSAKHRIEEGRQMPIVVVREIEGIDKTSRLFEVLLGLGLGEELARTKKRFRKLRSGRGRMRGRKRVRARGPLIIYKEDPTVHLAARNIPGVDAVSCNGVSVMHLAPGGTPGRLTIWSEPAIGAIQERFKGVI